MTKFWFSEFISTINWLAIMYLVLQPILRQRMLDAERTTMIRRIERQRASRLILLVHRKEVVNFLGFPLVQYLDIQDSEAILRAIRLTPPEMPIDLIVHTPAGLSLSCEQIARAIARHKGRVTVFIPHYALSGGTLLALAADEVMMSSDAILGALDPNINQFPAASILSLSERKKLDQLNDNTFIMLDNAVKALSQVRKVVVTLLKRSLGESEAEKIAAELTSGSYTQDYPISVDEACQMGLTVKQEMPLEIYQLMNLYPQSGSARPSVDYIPMPYPPIEKA